MGQNKLRLPPPMIQSPGDRLSIAARAAIRAGLGGVFRIRKLTGYSLLASRGLSAALALWKFGPLGQEDGRSPVEHGLQIDPRIMFFGSCAIVISRLPSTFRFLSFLFDTVITRYFCTLIQSYLNLNILHSQPSPLSHTWPFNRPSNPSTSFRVISPTFTK